MKKFLSVICMLVVSVLLFSGCASVNYSVIMNSEGKIEQAMQVNLDKNEITLAGYSYSEVYNNVVNDFDNYFYSPEGSLKIAVINYALKKNKSIDDCGIKLYRESLEDEGIIFGSIVFDSPLIYKEFYNITDDDDDQTIIEKTWFYNREISESETIFSAILKEGTSANQIADKYLDYFDGSLAGTTKKTLEDADYNFFYGVPTNKLYSNSDRVFTQSGITIHEWNFSASQLGDKIRTYTLAVKPTAWYILALVLTAVVVGIILIIGLLQKKFKKTENPIAQEEK